jgi:hypothetical protein
MKLFSRIVFLALIAALPATGSAIDRYEGTFAIGGIWLDEEGNRATTVETYNLFDGFSISQIRFAGDFDRKHYLSFNLREINLDSRKGELVYRIPGRLRVDTDYTQWRQIFDSDASVTSSRKDWRAGLNWTTGGGGVIRANYKHTRKSGGRLGYPLGTEQQSVLGTGYSYLLQTGMIEADLKRDVGGGSAGIALAYNFAHFDDRDASVQDRLGQMFTARLYGAAYLWPDRLTHLLRGAWGTQELSETGLSFDLASFQYTGVLRPHRSLQFKYNFYASRIDDKGTRLETDNIRNNFVLTYYHNYGQFYGGYGYETNDDDLTLTSYQTYLFGVSYRYEKKLRAQLEIGDRHKDDQGKTTLLEDIQTNRLLASLRYRILDDLYLGGKLTYRRRNFQAINVESEGELYNAYGGYEYPGWGSLVADYSYSIDNYKDIGSRFDVNTHIATARLQIDRIDNLVLVGGATYLDIGQDLNIEKSILFFEGKLTFGKDFFVEAKYNVYNYDDYLVMNRYYTANAVWINVGQNFKRE